MVNLNKEIREAKTLTQITSRGLNQLIGALRKVDYTDTSERNMHLIDGMIRGLAYMNAARHKGMYFEYKLKKLKRLQHAHNKLAEKKTRKLKAQIRPMPETYPPARWQHVEECDRCTWYDPSAYRCCIGGGVGCYYEPSLSALLEKEQS